MWAIEMRPGKRGRPGGGPKTGGRKKGVPNKKQAKLKAEISREVEMNGITPLEFMLTAMSDETRDYEFRCDMAAKAAPYIHAKKIHAEVDHTFTQLGDRLDQAMKRVRGTVVDVVPQIIDASEDDG